MRSVPLRAVLVAALALAAACGARTGMEIDRDGGPRDGPLLVVDAGPRDAGVPPVRRDGGGECIDECGRWILHFTPTARAQIAIWAENQSTGGFQTLMLTEAVARRGIGNRPGALQIGTAWRYPLGRREGVLPIWAHRRVAAGAPDFPRVIHADRPEGWGSRSTEDSSRDDYFCLSFSDGDEEVDTVSCASVLHSAKGRYLTESDLAAGYAEPYHDVVPALDFGMRPLSARSLYPMRTDITMLGRDDHSDVVRYAGDARAAMPELDAVTTATPAGDVAVGRRFEIPAGWRCDDLVVRLEINVEEDFGGPWTPDAYPLPTLPEGEWDAWARYQNRPYRGQPSVLYEVGAFGSTDAAVGHGSFDGVDGEIHPLADGIVDDPAGAPGSGADRLRQGGRGTRMQLVSECFAE